MCPVYYYISIRSLVLLEIQNLTTPVVLESFEDLSYIITLCPGQTRTNGYALQTGHQPKTNRASLPGSRLVNRRLHSPTYRSIGDSKIAESPKSSGLLSFLATVISSMSKSNFGGKGFL